MRILKIVLAISGLALFIAGLYNALVPQEVLELDAVEVSIAEGFTGQTIAMMVLGLLALLVGLYISPRRPR
jgi:hypothetical protein